MSGPDPLDVKRALGLLTEEYFRLLRDEEADAKQAATRHTALKAVLAHYAALLKLLPPQAQHETDLGALRAAIAQEMPSDDDDDEGDAG